MLNGKFHINEDVNLDRNLLQRGFALYLMDIYSFNMVSLRLYKGMQNFEFTYKEAEWIENELV